MKLLTKEIEDKLKAHPYGSQDGLGGNAEVLVKYFLKRVHETIKLIKSINN